MAVASYSSKPWNLDHCLNRYSQSIHEVNEILYVVDLLYHPLSIFIFLPQIGVTTYITNKNTL